MTAAAIKATFSDFKIIKSRNVAVLHFEVPLEGADAALAALGGLPQPASERWCGIARLTDEAAHKPDARERYAQKSPGEQAVIRAALLTKDDAFQQWIGGPTTNDPIAHASRAIRNHCGIDSRAELATNPEALQRFLDLEAKFKTERIYGPLAVR